MRRHIIGPALIFLILIAEDFFMGMFGHYTASGGSFADYLASITAEHILIILVVSILVYIVLWRFFKI